MNAVAKIERTVAGVVVPDTLLVTRAIEYARQHSEPYLFNHVMRSWLFAGRLAQTKDDGSRRGSARGRHSPA